MKIRLGTMAAMFIVLPITRAQTIEPSFETSYYEHEVRRTIIDSCGGQITQVHDAFDWRYYNVPYDNWWYVGVDNWVCREGCDKNYSFITWPDANTAGQNHRWGYGAEVPGPSGNYEYDACAPYDETTEELPSGSITYMGRQEWHTRRTESYGYVWDHTYYDGTFVNLLTGGTSGITNANSFFAVTMHARDQVSQELISNGNVRLWGRAADTNGDVWFAVLPDHAAVDVTPDVAGSYFHEERATNTQATYEHQIQALGYEPSVVKSTLIIRDASGMDVTGKTNIIWAGMRITLSVALELPIVPITNVNWSIPGDIYAGFFLSPAEGNLPIMATNGWPLNLTTVNTNSIGFAWLNRFTNAQITVSATVSGQAISAATTFDVREVTADFIGEIANGPQVYTQVSVDEQTSKLGLGRYDAGVNDASNRATAGIRWTITNLNLNGYTGYYALWVYQVGSAYQWVNQSDGTSIEQFGAGLDTRFYGSAYLDTNYAVPFDSPFLALTGNYKTAYKEGHFTCYLVWKADPGIIAPIRYVSWNFRAKATNGPPWGLVVDQSSAAITENNREANGLGSWLENIAIRPTVRTNNYWLP